MDKLRIIGGTPLRGSIPISGAKNAALPLMCVALLTDQPLTLTNIPHLGDVASMAGLLGELGVELALEGDSPSDGHAGRVVRLQAKAIRSHTAPYELVRKMRASVLVLGPLLTREGVAKVSLPGGCAIGTRPIDLHLKALEQLGATIELKEGYVEAQAKDGLKGAEIYFDKVSVGATENLLMAAVLAKGETIIGNAAREPEVTDLAECLVRMGAQIEGIGTDTLKITGVKGLKAAEHRIIPDRIEAGSFAAAAAITGGDITLKGMVLAHMEAPAVKMRASGVEIAETPEGVHVKASGRLKAQDVETHPFPGFATDMQAQFMAMMTVAEGTSTITESIFENRFMHVPELLRMGADIAIHGHSAVVKGVEKLKGAPVMATDLRASLSLVLAALVAEGETIISRIYHLDRGYENVEEKLSACGADITRIS